MTRGLIALGVASTTWNSGVGPEKGVIEVLSGVQLVVGSSRVRQFLQDTETGRVRVFAGYAGWSAGQS